jgi:predicted enzyme related to lactoylglutathione lyase
LSVQPFRRLDALILTAFLREEGGMRRTLGLSLLVLLAFGPRALMAQARIEYRPSLLVQLSVANLDKAIAFYTKTLEFELTERRDDLKFAHIDTNVPGLQFGLNEVPKPGGTGGLVVNISVRDVAAARTLLESRGVVFDGPTAVIQGSRWQSVAARRPAAGRR